MSVVIDIILVAILAIQIIHGWKKGLSGVVLGFARIILSFLLAVILGKSVAGLFAGVTSHVFLQNVLGYISTFIFTFLACTIVIFFIKKINIPIVSTIDTLLGIIIGSVLGILTVALITSLLSSLLAALTSFTGNPAYFNVYESSHVFKFIDNVNVFGFLKNFLK